MFIAAIARKSYSSFRSEIIPLLKEPPQKETNRIYKHSVPAGLYETFGPTGLTSLVASYHYQFEASEIVFFYFGQQRLVTDAQRLGCVRFAAFIGCQRLRNLLSLYQFHNTVSRFGKAT